MISHRWPQTHLRAATIWAVLNAAVYIEATEARKEGEGNKYKQQQQQQQQHTKKEHGRRNKRARRHVYLAIDVLLQRLSVLDRT